MASVFFLNLIAEHLHCNQINTMKTKEQTNQLARDTFRALKRDAAILRQIADFTEQGWKTAWTWDLPNGKRITLNKETSMFKIWDY